MWFCKSAVSRLEESGGKCVLALKTLLVLRCRLLNGDSSSNDGLILTETLLGICSVWRGVPEPTRTRSTRV